MMLRGSHREWLRVARRDCKRVLGAHDIYAKVARSGHHVVPRNAGGEGVFLPWYSYTYLRVRRSQGMGRGLSRKPKALARRLRALVRRIERVERLAARRIEVRRKREERYAA